MRRWSASRHGAVNVVDAATDKVRQIPGFATSEVEIRRAKRVLGPTAVSIGEGVVYIGNRGDSTVCAFNSRSLARGACGHLDSMPDGVAYVAPAKEVWVTTPRDKSIRVLDGTTLAQKAKLTFDGNPEGYAVDARRGRFYTNLEDKDRTLAIDLTTQETVATWNPSCGKEGPHGLAVDSEAGHLFVACSTLAEVLDAGRDGAILSMVETGDGVDDINYAPAKHLLYVGAARAETHYRPRGRQRSPCDCRAGAHSRRSLQRCSRQKRNCLSGALGSHKTERTRRRLAQWEVSFAIGRRRFVSAN